MKAVLGLDDLPARGAGGVHAGRRVSRHRHRGRGHGDPASPGLPHSDALVVYAKLWLATDDVMKDEITLVDRKAYTRPWTVTKTYERARRGTQVMPYVCLENNRNPLGPDGKTTVNLKGGQ